MSDPTTPDPPAPDEDERASALLDDEPIDGQPVAPTPQLRRRADQLKVAADAVGAPVPGLAPDVVDRLVEAALTAADVDAGTDPLAPLAPPRRGTGKARRRLWLPPPAVAAAVVVVVALVGIALIVTDGRSGQGSRASQTAAADRAAAAKVAAGEASAAATAPDTLRPVPRLGTFDDQAALRRALGTIAPTSLEAAADAATAASGAGAASPSVPAPASTSAPVPTSASGPATRIGQKVIVRCDDVIHATDPSLGARSAVASATVGGRRVLVYSHPESAPAATGTAASPSTGPPHTRITVADQQTCAILFAVRR